jgi:hypothetical protein
VSSKAVYVTPSNLSVVEELARFFTILRVDKVLPVSLAVIVAAAVISNFRRQFKSFFVHGFS